VHKEAVEYIPRHTTSMTQNIFNDDIFRVLQTRRHEIISQQPRHWRRPLRIREFVTVVHEECNGCSSEGFCRASAVEERVGCCALVRNSCKSIALCQVSEVQHTWLEQAQEIAVVTFAYISSLCITPMTSPGTFHSVIAFRIIFSNSGVLWAIPYQTLGVKLNFSRSFVFILRLYAQLDYNLTKCHGTGGTYRHCYPYLNGLITCGLV